MKLELSRQILEKYLCIKFP